MTDESPAQDWPDEPSATDDLGSSETSDSALLEEALRDALDAHAAGLLAAPFGLDGAALRRARRRALRSDIRRLLSGPASSEQHPNEDT